GGDIERQPVQRHATPHAYTDRTHLGQGAGAGGVLGPDADGAVVFPGCDAELRQGVDDRLFQSADVSADAKAVLVKVNNVINDELARAVEGDVAAAVGRDNLDDSARQHLRPGDDVALDARAAADG